MLNKNIYTPLKGEVEKARDLYETNDIQIDENAMISLATDGIWVQAWVWLSNEDGDQL